jgi:hypothetical protein
MLNKAWNSFKAWFKHSWSIFIARLEVLAGVLTGALGALDWSAIANLDWTQGVKNTGTLIVAGLLIVKGIVSEIGRRAGTVETKDSVLVPTAVVDTAEIKVK